MANTTTTSMESEAAGDRSAGNISTTCGKAGSALTETVNILIYLLIKKKTHTILPASFVLTHLLPAI